MAEHDLRQIADTLRRHRAEISTVVTAEFLARHPDWKDRYGELAWIRGREDAEFHLDFLAGAVVAQEPAAFADYARWAARVLVARGIDPRFLAENLRQVRDQASRHVGTDARLLLSHTVEAALSALSQGPDPEPDDEDRGPFGLERSVYLQAVLAGDRKAALNVTLEALESGATVPAVYGGILQPVQYRLGRLWEEQRISVAEEHMATAVTQYVIGQLYSRLDVSEVDRGRAVVTGVSGELHQLGGNMVADVLEADGWNVRFLGTQLPHRDVVEAIQEHDPRIVGISVAALSNLPAVADLVSEIRRSCGGDVVVLVGGAAFRRRPEAWRSTGADGFGRDLDDAVQAAREFAPTAEA